MLVALGMQISKYSLPAIGSDLTLIVTIFDLRHRTISNYISFVKAKIVWLPIRFSQLRSVLEIGQKLCNYWGGVCSDICPHEKPKKLTLPFRGKKIVTLPKNHPEKM